MRNRRRALVLLAGGAIGGYAWHERRGLTRADFDWPEPAGLHPRVGSLLLHAALAPSGHNTQPWTVRMSGDGLRIGSNRSRWLPRVDPENREMALSIGALLENLIVAAPGHGYGVDYSVTGGSASDAELIAVRLAPRPQSGREALEGIRLRRTVRTGQLARPLSSGDIRDCLGHFGALPGGDTAAYFFPRDAREGRYLAEGTIEANRVQARRDDAQAELAAWIRFSDEDARSHRDGLTPESMEISGVAGWYLRHFLDRGSAMGQRFREQGVDRVRQQVASCGGWIVVTSADRSLGSLVETGRRTERMWLAARERRVAIHPMTQLLEEAPFRDGIGRELGIGRPIQFVLRVGYVEKYPLPVSLRRQVEAS